MHENLTFSTFLPSLLELKWYGTSFGQSTRTKNSADLPLAFVRLPSGQKGISGGANMADNARVLVTGYGGPTG